MLINSILSHKTSIKSKKFNEEIIELCSPVFSMPKGFRYKVIRVSKLHIARPDLLSYQLYGSDIYGDLICKINGISNPFELNEGMILVIPSASDLDSFYSNINYLDEINADGDDYTKPVAKSRSEKRRANEAVIGDSRFKIDSTNRVIVY